MTSSFLGGLRALVPPPLALAHTSHPLPFLLDAHASGRVNKHLPYRVPVEGRTTIFSTVVLSGSRRASTTVRATVSADIILRLGAFGQSVFQIAVSVAPGIRAITRMPFGLSSSRSVLVKPSAPCLDAL